MTAARGRICIAAFLAFGCVLIIGIVVVGSLAAQGGGYASPVAYWLALVVVVTTGVKFLLADLLSKDGFDVEKTVADVALALSAAFFSLALGLQFGPARPDVGTNLVFAASVTFHDKLLHSSATPLVKAQQAIWLIAVGSLLSVAVTTWLAWNARTIREKQATIPPWRLSLYRGSSVLLGALTYAIYFVLLLYRP